MCKSLNAMCFFNTSHICISVNTTWFFISISYYITEEYISTLCSANLLVSFQGRHFYWSVHSRTIDRASWLSGTVRDLQARDRGFDPRLRWICFDVVLLGKALCSHMHSLDPGVSGYLVRQWRLVCLNRSVRRKMAAGLYAPRGVEMAYEWTGPVTRG